jgi:hypothetical protein
MRHQVWKLFQETALIANVSLDNSSRNMKEAAVPAIQVLNQVAFSSLTEFCLNPIAQCRLLKLVALISPEDQFNRANTM